MVNSLAVKKPSYHVIDSSEIKKNELKWGSISLSEVINMKKRLEATVFDVEAKHAREIVAHSKWQKVSLAGENSILSNAFYPARFKRVYCDAANGIPFYLPSQMCDINPKAEKYISKLTKCDFNELKLKYGDILLTRSGTIGNLTIVSKTLENKVFSDDVIRITCKENLDIGFLYAFLKSKIGNKILQTNNYGSVVTHIEPEHLAEIPIPYPSTPLREKINDLIINSFELRDESNALIEQATNLLIEELRLPPIKEFSPNKFDFSVEVNNFIVKLSELQGRNDASYHIPIVDAIKDHISTTAAEITAVGDKRISKDVLLPGRFKRVYVEEGSGRAFFGGKQLYELDPSNKKYLSIKKHSDRIEREMEILENTILISRSGTIGKVALTPKHWEHWIASEHIIRIVPASKDIAGYLSVFLSTEYGNIFITRNSFGSVVDEIDVNQVSRIPVPLLRNLELQLFINNLALEANSKRYLAYQLEQEAMNIMENEVLYEKK